MREIEFRALNSKREFVHGYLVRNIKPVGERCICGVMEIHQPYGDWNEEFEVYDKTVGQFTGLHDCDGVKIFEGDIVSDHNGIGSVEYSEKKAAFKVNYHDGFAKWFTDYNLKGERESIKVIGNIHQHAHLLEKS